MRPEKTMEKHRLVRILRMVMDLNEARMEWVCGSGWKEMDLVYLDRLEQHVQRIMGRLHNAFGDNDEGAVEFLEELIIKIREAHGSANDELVKLLKNPMPSVKLKKVMKEKGYSMRDTNRAAREIGVIREYRDRPKKKSGQEMWWSLPDEN